MSLKIEPKSNRPSPIAHRQDGVTLILGLVLLAAITLVSFSLSVIIIREIRTARILSKTEPAIAGANAGGEIGLYRMQRNIAGGIGATGSMQQSQTNYTIVPNLYINDYPFSIITGQHLTVGLYDAEDFANQNLPYRSITVINANGGPVKVDFFPWADSTNIICSPNVPSGQSTTCNLAPPDYRYVVSINKDSSGTTSGIIRAYSGSGGSGSQIGIPSDTPIIESTGITGEVRRKIQIKLK